MFNRFSLGLLFVFLSEAVIAQTHYPSDYFRSPIDPALSLAGNFGEIRPNHFHAGFDLKTNNREGLPVYAAADGYVSRVKTGAYGYGKVLYINHPNGYTTVYGHLRNFNSTIAGSAKKIQYYKESFEIDSLLTPEQLPVKKGDIIAYSGNTGGSQGPHLHFEIRDTKTESPINPYYFGYAVKDNVKPVITKIAVYPIGETAVVNGKHLTKKIKPVRLKGVYSLSKTDSVTVNGDIGFGVECFDTETGSTNQNAVFSIELQSDGKRIYYEELEKFTFENARYVNAHIDYQEKQKHNERIQKCFLSKNNLLGIYKDIENGGVVSFTDNSVHWIKYIVKDFAGNSTEFTLKVRSTSKNKLQKTIAGSNLEVYDCLKSNQCKKQDVEILIPPYALYDDLKFKTSVSPSVRGMYSKIYHVQDDETALQKAYTLNIKPDNLPGALESKAAIISIKAKGKQSYEGGNYKNGWVSAQINTFGNFAVTVDTTAPKISPVFKVLDKNNVDFRNAKMIGIKAYDNLSGIKKYRASIDGKWVLCEYEFKKQLLFYTFDEAVQKGKHTFNIEVTDNKNNISTWTCTFLR